MLQIKTIEPGTLSLLKGLMAQLALKDFSLVGGTALALKLGHRKSIDLDFFSNVPFENDKVIEALKKEYNEEFSLVLSKEKFGIFCFIQSVKVDIVKHPHPIIAPVEIVDE